MKKISFFANSDIGKMRSNNEDAYVAQWIWNDKNLLAVAIDGVGGYEGGEVAADIAKTSIVSYLEKYPNGERRELLKQAVIHANNEIYRQREKSEEYKEMSCVLTAILVELDEKLIHMAHVGDTRFYQFVDREIQKLSHDHSLVGYREEIGDLTEEEAMKHPQRNVISKDVGSEYLDNNNEYIEIATFTLMPNSTLLLCSDGLTDMLSSKQILSILSNEDSIEGQVNQLIKCANDMGGRDNITVVLIKVETNEPLEPILIIKEDDISNISIKEKELMLEIDNINHARKSYKLVGIISCIFLLIIALVFWAIL